MPAKTAEDILGLWKTAARKGLGTGKRFDPDIFDEFDSKFVDSINALLLATPPVLFDRKAEQATKAVARDLGKVCRMLTLKKTVSVDTFQAVFELMRVHPACPTPGLGSGTWCDIG